MKAMKLDEKSYLTPEVDALTQQELAALKKDELVYPMISEQLRLTRKEAEIHLAALLDYRDDVHYCANCPGLENCAKSHPYFTLRLEREDGTIARHYDPCEKMLSLASFQKRYIRCSFPADWRDEDLRSIERSVSSRKSLMLEMAKAVKGIDADRWFYVLGNGGSGKSFLLAAFANTLTKRDGAGAFCDTASLMEDLKEKAINNRDSFDQLMKDLQRCSVLVLDDFGNEYKTEFVYTSILFPLLSARDKMGLITCFASDFSIKDIVGMYRPKIGYERASQLEKLLKRRCKEEFDVTGVSIY